MDQYYTEEDKLKVREINEDFVQSLKQAILNKNIDVFFQGFGFKPRYLDIISILFCFPDGEEIVRNLYDHILENIRDIHIPSLVEQLEPRSSFHPLLIRDFEKLFQKSLDSSNLLTNNIINFIRTMVKIPGGDLLALDKMEEILKKINPTLVSTAVLLFKGKEYFPKYLKDNLGKLIETSRGCSILEIVKKMLELDEKYAIEYIKNNLERILVNLGSGQICEMLNVFIKYEELVDLIKENKELILDCSNAYDINGILARFDEPLNLGILKNNDFLALIKDKLTKEKQMHLAVGAIVRSRQNDYLKDLFNFLLELEQVNDFDSIGDKTWSNLVFKVGNKVLKIGWVRNNPNCDEYYRVLNSDSYEIIYDEESNPILFIEIQPFLSNEGITDEDIEDFYIDIEKDGYIYIDPRGKDISNFGILTDDLYNQLNPKVFSKSFQKKHIVLTDRDCFWKKADPNIKYMQSY